MNAAAEQRELFPSHAQFRIARLQVFNWGTFDGLHDIPIAERGFLFVGRSGSGKTTLLDAVSALLIPPRWIDFNAAARDATHKGRDRNWATYIRGAWSEQQDEATGEIAARYLRTGTTWSALALTFRGMEGRTVVLVGLFWLRGRSTGAADVRRHFIIFERPFDLAELEAFNLDLRRLKHELADGNYFATFNPYCERFRRLLHIESELALRLLHKTQSAKSLGDLNAFLRDFMLDTPETFDVARTLVAEFAELNEAHQAVVTARRQVQTLAPARDKHQRLLRVRAQHEDLDLLRSGIDVYRDRLRVQLLEARIEDLGVRVEGLNDEARRREASAAQHQRTLQELEEQHGRLGGDRIERLEAEKKEREADRSRRSAKQAQARMACDRLAWEPADGPMAFAELRGRARQELEARGQQARDARDRRDHLTVAVDALEKEFKETAGEVASLERQPSNIPARMLDLRRRIAKQAGLDAAALPFVGELIEVLPREARWRGAIERVLHGFALSMLVDERHYGAVSGVVNGMHLGQRLVYYRVAGVNPAAALTVSIQSLAGKLQLKEGSYQKWLRGELNHRFNYICVDSVAGFKKHERALTPEGLVRHGKTRHEKDDRRSIDDRRHWVLGFDNHAKLALYKQQAQALAERIAAGRRDLDALQAEEERRAERALHCQTLVNLQWEELDTTPLIDRIAALETQLDEIRRGNQALQEIAVRMTAARRQRDQAQNRVQEIKVDIREVEKEIRARQTALDEMHRTAAAQTLAAGQQEALADRFEALGRAAALDNLDALTHQVERRINEELKALSSELHQLERGIESCFADFISQWAAESEGLDAKLAAAEDFLAKLRRLEIDGLPRHERRFFDLLKDQSHQNLAALNTHLRQARNEIRERMELVNEGLRHARFNRGTYLRIDVADRHLPTVQEFKREIHDALRHAWTEDRETAERRFAALRRLVDRLADQDPQQRRWRDEVLDVRLHVEFIARELDGQGNEVEVYRSGAGKSGGQRQKLATTCLAAALRYQLGGREQSLPACAPVVLDEAFDKADNEFTALAMNIFTRFGFQMIVATPLKSVMTLEPFIGGACFVDINERQRSGVLLIEYDDQRQRLNLPEQVRDDTIAAIS
ncbi:ATP-binding protein [Desulfatitalea alkaliphila]|uniref:Sigma-54 factor interaction domain-containing protein n=1 Tax=Desulfatitalea alkaliphila TaxID=2929485 RepID=A0AA41UHN3_9BACT|nr:SbcC/MukB-like Walker B domain-containing protein [Desulfatitalea alkaliphila]MCJ8499800.1 hypothetical protein [Desulfatitalea alkaliphila]